MGCQLIGGKKRPFHRLLKAAFFNNQLMFRPPPAEVVTMSTAPLLRLFHRKNAGPSTLRMNVCPPDIVPARDSLWTSALRWLVGGDTHVVPALRTPLERARSEFVAAMEGLVELDPNDLLNRARHARSLRELWHLRSELYTLIARRISQGEADVRLGRVNQHFPTRTQRASTFSTDSADVQ
jgi:hypothetical protein